MAVILVPLELKKCFKAEDQQDAIRIESDDHQDWNVPLYDEWKALMDFVQLENGRRFIVYGPGKRVGGDNHGIYIHQNHLRRYYGILRESASVTLRAAVPEAL